MEFFNRKEEVMDIQLTQHGKYLLSKGRLNPKYYAFYDDDVIYDTQYAGDPLVGGESHDGNGYDIDHGGFGEHPSEAEARITTTPRIKARHVFEGAETRISKIVKSEAFQELPNDEKLAALEPAILASTAIYGLSSEMGTSAFNSSKAPAWNIKFIDGSLSGATNYHTGSLSVKTEQIPQLDVVSTTKVGALTSEEYDDLIDMDESLGDSNEFISEETHGLQLADIFEDGSSFQVLSDMIILDVEEFNAPKRDLNFDIEIFEIVEEKGENGVTTSEELRPLHFPPGTDVLIEGLSIENDGDVVSNTVGETAENQNYVHYYMDVHVDNQVQTTGFVPAGAPQVTTLVTSLPGLPENDIDCPDDEEEN